MVIGMDIDGTITRMPELFACMSKGFVGAGHRVVIITFREDRAGTEADLAGWGIAYDELICSTLERCLEDGVDEWKSKVCRRKGVEVLFEDDPAVLAHVGPEVLCLMPVEEDKGNLGQIGKCGMRNVK